MKPVRFGWSPQSCWQMIDLLFSGAGRAVNTKQLESAVNKWEIRFSTAILPAHHSDVFTRVQGVTPSYRGCSGWVIGEAWSMSNACLNTLPAALWSSVSFATTAELPDWLTIRPVDWQPNCRRFYAVGSIGIHFTNISCRTRINQMLLIGIEPNMLRDRHVQIYYFRILTRQ